MTVRTQRQREFSRKSASYSAVRDDVTPSFYVGNMSMPVHHEPRTACSSCESDLQHCHGTALVREGCHVCSDDPDCMLGVDEHWFVAVDQD